LKNIFFEIKKREFVSIVGCSGAGKTTILKLILAEERPTSGKIFFEEKDITKISSKELLNLRRQIGVVFQDYRLLMKKTVYENVAYILEALDFSDAEISLEVPQVLEIVGLSEKISHFPAELSVGEKQRLAIARALIHRPKVVLADEPTGNLDPYNTADILKILLKIHQFGTTVILTTHNKEIVNQLKKRVISLEEGRIIRDEKVGRFIL
jgi:cell division transport system ATP-binding protein